MGAHNQKRLTAQRVKSEFTPGKYLDGMGLYLIVDDRGNKRWLQRIMVDGKRRELGLGSANLISLQQARKQAEEHKRQFMMGIDPTLKRKKRLAIPTFQNATLEVHKGLLPTWRNPKHGAQWLSSMAGHVFPHLGNRRVSDIEVSDLLEVFSPIWIEKHETASRNLQRCRQVFDRAIALKWRKDNPAIAAKSILPKAPKGMKKKRKALDYDKIQTCICAIQNTKANLITKLALEFLILTASRTGEVLGAQWQEVDLDKALWVIPADRMKATAEHRIPLARRALAILREVQRLSGNQTLVFPSAKMGKQISDATMRKLIHEQGYNVDVHGFRATFRTWAQDHTDYPREVVEGALAHREGNQTVAAYARSDLLTKRLELMKDWESWCARKA